MEVIECTKGHYDVQEVQFGTVYRWCPERVVVECDCGQRTTLTRLESVCPRCDADHAAIIQQELADDRVGDETMHPWHYGELR
jgi:Zn finger protein HypA/HybF involved in hydrogenase expression